MPEIRSRVEAGVATLTISQPERLNALNKEMWEVFPRVLRDAADRPETRVVIVEGDGSRAFSSGADISEFAQTRSTVEDAERYSLAVSAALRELTRLRIPSIARVRGVCSGGGAAIALSCHVRFASETLRFAIRAARLGIVYEYEAIERLVLVAGQATAYDLLSTGRTVDAGEARGLGLVNDVLPESEIVAHVDAYAAGIARNAPIPIEGALVAVAATAERDPSMLLRRLECLQSEAIESDDYAEGRRAFAEKRSPHFRGR